MVDGISAVGSSTSQINETCTGIDAFLAKATGGMGIEELILQDTQAQRKAATAVRKAQREQRRRLVERAVKKMKDAADNRFWSGFVGALSGIAGELLGTCNLGKWTKVICESTKFLGGNLVKHFAFDVPATDQEGDAKLLQDAAQASGEAARDTGEWLASAKELERRMVDRIDQLTRSEHENRMNVLNRIGG
jgi:hypothetical protein